MRGPCCRIWLLIAILIIPAVASGGPSKKIAKQTIKEFNLEPRTVRADHLLLPINYVEHAGRSYGYHLPRRFQRLARQGDTFTIKKTKYKKRSIRLEMISHRKAKITLTLFDNRELTQDFLDDVLQMALSDLFQFREPPAGARLVGHSGSHMVHLRGCNHLPRETERVPLATADEAEAAGYRRCPACFSDRPPIPIDGYAPLRAVAVEQARLHELAFPLVDDPSTQAALQELGESIVEDFPIETIGFDYAFKLVHSELPQARSFYTGFVYVTDKLMSMIEEPAELEFILAHEITHAELHRPPPPLYTFGTAAEVKSQINSYYRSLRYRETEADLMGLLYLAGRGETAEPIRRARNALAKLQFVNEAVPVDRVSLFATHPSYASRLALFDPDSFELCPTADRIYCGIDKHGETLVELRVLGKGRGSSAARVYLMITTTDLLNKTIEHPSGRVKDGRGKSLALVGRSRIPPGTDTLVEMTVEWYGRHQRSAKTYDRFSLDEVQEAKLEDVEGVKKWIVCEE